MKGKFDPARSPPNFLFIEITKECNLRCKQCHMWMTTDNPKKALTIPEKIGLLEEFHLLNDKGTVVFTGGETMGKPEEFYSLSRTCRDLGLVSAANTNGTYIRTIEDAIRLIKEGPHHIVVSLDSHIGEKHDYLRGRKGTYEIVVNALHLLANAKESSNGAKKTNIIVNSILSDLNYSDLEELIEFVRSLGVDGITFQIISRTFYRQTENDPAFDLFFPKDPVRFKLKLDAIIERYGNDPFVMTSGSDFEWMKLYVDDPDFIGEPVCASHENNMMVDCEGHVQLCFGMAELMNGQFLGNVKKFSLEELWRSKKANIARDLMSKCRENCGMLNCHRRVE